MDKKDPAIFQYVEPDDLLKFGLIPELAGRLPVTTALNNLTRKDLKRVLTEPKSAIVRQYQKLFALDGVDLYFDDDALDVVVDRALALGTGARGLRSIMESTLTDLMFDLPAQPGGSCVITRATLDGAPPLYSERKAAA